MAALLHLDQFPKTADLVNAVDKQFAGGAEIIHLAADARIVGCIVDPGVAREMLARRVAERLVADPSALQELADRLAEKPEAWE
jgi:hypothetical protein